MTNETFLQLAERHRKLDQLAQGSFEWTGKACSIGCFNHDLGQEPGDFKALAEYTGYPEWAHRLQEVVFEGLPKDDAINWHVDFARTCEGVTDWTAKYHKTMIGILEVAKPYDTSEGQVVQRVIDLHKRGPAVTPDEWRAARDAARDAAADAEWAAWPAAWAAARDAAGAAWAAARDANAAVWPVNDVWADGHATWRKIAADFCEQGEAA